MIKPCYISRNSYGVSGVTEAREDHLLLKWTRRVLKHAITHVFSHPRFPANRAFRLQFPLSPTPKVYQLTTVSSHPPYYATLSTLSIIQMANREDSVYLAKLAEQAERYEGEFVASLAFGRADSAEMVENMKTVASSDQELTVEERNLLSVAYKNVIGARRASWRIVSSIEQKEESKGNEAQVKMIKEYREKIEAELAKICEDILEVLEKHLIPSAASGESKVFYHKM